MAVGKTSLSAGEIIRAILIDDDEVAARTKKVFPVVTDSAELPYILYRRTQLTKEAVKGRVGADTVGIEILCYTADYTEGVELAEPCARLWITCSTKSTGWLCVAANFRIVRRAGRPMRMCNS